MSEVSSLASPKLEDLRQQVASGNHMATEMFWHAIIRQGAPLVEPIPGEDKHALVTFLWRAAHDAEPIAVVSALPGQEVVEALHHLPGTDVWHRTYKVRNDTRESYQFAVAGQNVIDPFNPRRHTFPGDTEIGFTGWESSV